MKERDMTQHDLVLLLTAGVKCEANVGPYEAGGPYFINLCFPESELFAETLHTTRGKIRFFATLDAVAKFLKNINIPDFMVHM